MKIETINFIDFFDPEKRKIKNKFGRMLGLGAVSVITPNQCITRYNKAEKDDNGNLILGMGSHDDNKVLIAGEILGIKKELEDYSIDEAVGIANFLSEVIILEYSNNRFPCILMNIPENINNEQIEVLKMISDKLKKLPEEYGKLSIYCEIKSRRTYNRRKNNLTNTIMEAEKYVNNNYRFPYKEKNSNSLDKDEIQK